MHLPFNHSPDPVGHEDLTETLSDLANDIRFFTATELMESIRDEAMFRDARQNLMHDPQYISLQMESDGEYYFIPESTLFSWFVRLNLRLARIRNFRLTQHQTALTLSY